ncbi:MAG: hypothetical protein ABI253_01750 [Mycobacterium sp.]
MDDTCRACRAGLEHCHGTLIRHVLHTAECTEDGCTRAEAIPHLFVIDCEAAGCRCAQPAAIAV